MSWSIVAQNISRELINQGHSVDLFSTNGIQYFPEDLKPYLKGYVEENCQITKNVLDSSYDMQLSYTALRNFGGYFVRGNSNRFGIWNYETTVLPKGFSKYANCVDKVLPSSEFSKKIFMDNGMPAEKQVVIPHGINLEKFNNPGKYPLKTKKKYKILANIAQPHLRKNIPGLFKAWGKAFTRADDVCLVLKISKKSSGINNVNVPFDTIYADFKKEFKNHAEIEIIDSFIIDIEPLYNACDVGFTMTMAECFHMPSLEAMAAGKIVVSPRYGGQLDFLNDDNSILIDGKEIRADNRLQYWEPSPYAKVFEPDVEQAAEKLRDLILNYDDYMKKFSDNMKKTVEKYTWKKVVEKIIKQCK